MDLHTIKDIVINIKLKGIFQRAGYLRVHFLASWISKSAFSSELDILRVHFLASRIS